jgi:hypothetical protein
MLAEFKSLDLVFVTENRGGVISVYSVGDMPLKSYTMQATVVETEALVDSDKIVGIPVGTPTDMTGYLKSDVITIKDTVYDQTSRTDININNSMHIASSQTWEGVYTIVENSGNLIIRSTDIDYGPYDKSAITLESENLTWNNKNIATTDITNALSERINGLTSSGITRQIVSSLSDITDPDESTIYMVGPKTNETGNNIYEEYMFINGTAELIGSTEVDLTGYIQSNGWQTSNDGVNMSFGPSGAPSLLTYGGAYGTSISTNNNIYIRPKSGAGTTCFHGRVTISDDNGVSEYLVATEKHVSEAVSEAVSQKSQVQIITWEADD